MFLRGRALPLLTSDDPSSSSCVSTEQQTSMATTVAVSPSEYLQPSTASTQVSRNIKQVFVSLSGKPFEPDVAVLQTLPTQKATNQLVEIQLEVTTLAKAVNCNCGNNRKKENTNIYKNIRSHHAIVQG